MVLTAVARVSASSRTRSCVTDLMEPACARTDTRACFARAFAPRDGTVMAASTNARAKMVPFVITFQAAARARRDLEALAATKRATRVHSVRTARLRALVGMVPNAIVLLASATVSLVFMVSVANESVPMEGLA